MRNSIIVTLVVSVLIISIVTLPAFGDKPIWDPAHHDYPPAMDGKHGSVTGRVTTSVNGTLGIGGAYIAIVNASNVSQEYYNTTSDAGGNYQITGINATYSSLKGIGSPAFHNDYMKGTNAYKMYAYMEPYGEGYSAAFGIDENQSAATTTSVVIFTKPARIVLTAERPYVLNNDSDNILITATMYDALGNPVADGYNINFTVGNATNNSFMGHGDFAYPGGYTPGQYGSLATAGNNANLHQGTTTDNTGSTGVQFGWVSGSSTCSGSTVWAYYDDYEGQTKVNASIYISFDNDKNPAISSVMVNKTSVSSNDTIKVSYTLSNIGNGGNTVYLEILDSSGTIVSTIPEGVQSDGSHDIYWSGCYVNGSHVPAGDYSIKVALQSPECSKGQLKFIKQREYLYSISDITLDSTGNIIVADNQANAVKRLYSNGSVQSIGSGFGYPSNVVTDSNGNIYVSDQGDDTLKEIYTNGTTKILAYNFYSYYIAIDTSGNIYGNDYYDGLVKIYPNGTIVNINSTMKNIDSLAVDQHGNIFVVLWYGGSPNFYSSICEVYANNTVIKLQGLPYVPQDIVVDSHDNVYLTDYDNGTIPIIYANNTLSTYYSNLVHPLRLTMGPGNDLYVSESGQVVVIDSNGSSSITKPDLQFPQWTVTDVDGNIYVTDGTQKEIKILYTNGATGLLAKASGFPDVIDRDTSGNIYYTDPSLGNVNVVHPDGTVNSIGSGFEYPVGLDVDAAGNVYVADMVDNAIKIVYPNNTTKNILHCQSPMYVNVDTSGNIYYINHTSTSTWQVHKLSSDGTLVTLGKDLVVSDTPYGFAVDNSGNVFVLDFFASTVDVIRSDGRYSYLHSDHIRYPTSLSIDPEGNLYVIDHNAISEFAYPFLVESDPIGISVTGIPSSYTYSLTKGWNLISVPLSPSNNSFDAFFPDGVKSHVIVVWAYNTSTKAWAYYTPQSGYDPNTLATVDTSHGYWVKVDQDESFTIYGSTGSGPTLVQGWNLVGYPSITTGDPAAVYPSAFVIWQYKNNQWNYFTSQSGYDPNTLTVMEPGYGYWVKVA